MTAKLLDGKALAAQIKADLTERVKVLAAARDHPGPGDRPGRRRSRQPVVRGGQTPGLPAGGDRLHPGRAARRNVTGRAEGQNRRAKRGPGLHRLPRADPAARSLDDGWALGLVDPAKDADGLHPMNLGRLVLGEPGPLPCTPRGLVELLRRNGIDLAGKVVCVIGRGTTVGRPLGLLLSRKSENATVILCHTGTVDVAAHTRQADVIVAAAGRPGSGHRRHGQARCGLRRRRHHPNGATAWSEIWTPACTRWPRSVAPVPGGVGPMTRAMLLTNVVERAEACRTGEACGSDALRLRRPASLPHRLPPRVRAAGGRCSSSAPASLLGLVISVVGPDSWRLGGLVIGCALLVGAAIRIVLPAREVGLLQVRSRGFDIAALTIGGVAIIALAIAIPPGR